MKERVNRNDIELSLATENDAQLIHDIKYKAFLPLYEKYHDDKLTRSKILSKEQSIL